MRLRPGIGVLWRGPTAVQLGTDDRWAVALVDLDPAAARALASLPPGADVRAVRERLTREGVDPREVEAVLAHLAAAGHLVPVGAPTAGAPEADAWSLLAADGDGAAVLRRRGRAVVELRGGARLTAVVATTLAAAGVGTLLVRGDGPVQPHDVGLAGLGTRHVGSTVAAAVGQVLADVAPHVRTQASRARDLVVLVEEGVADPAVHGRLLADDVPHLSVLLREASVLVGPLVVPGVTACLRCVELHRTVLDPAWPVVATQLRQRRVPVRLEAGLAAVAGALAATAVLAWVDGRPVTVRDAALELRLPDVVPRRLTWERHPECGCGAEGPLGRTEGPVGGPGPR